MNESTRRATWVLLIGAALICCSCQADAPRNDRAVPAASAEAASSPLSPRTLDMDAIFPPGPGRELVLLNCTNCHSFLRIVLLPRTREQWQVVKNSMRPQVAGLSDGDVDLLFDYLHAHFNGKRPPPVLPRWFLEAMPY